MERTKAFIWCELRETLLKILDGNELDDLSLPDFLCGVKDLCDGISACKPSAIYGPPVGDSGWVEFSDGSKVKWDWDNGDFEYEGVMYTYPYQSNTTDPLYWNKELFK